MLYCKYGVERKTSETGPSPYTPLYGVRIDDIFYWLSAKKGLVVVELAIDVEASYELEVKY